MVIRRFWVQPGEPLPKNAVDLSCFFRLIRKPDNRICNFLFWFWAQQLVHRAPRGQSAIARLDVAFHLTQLACPVMAVISIALQPASASLDDAALRKPWNEHCGS